MINAGINLLTALLRVPNAALPDLPKAWFLTAAAAVWAVTQAHGIFLNQDQEKRLRAVCQAMATNRSSIL